jgi:hypothetical protein
LHLHHEDFTTIWEVFWRLQKCTWYIEDKKEAEDLASKLGFTKVSEEKEL